MKLLCSTLALLVLSSVLCGQEPKKQSEISVEEKHVRDRFDLKFQPKEFIFDGSAFPEVVFDDPKKASDLLERHWFTLNLFNERLEHLSGRQLESPAATRPGPFAFSVQLSAGRMQRDEHPYRRDYTVFRIAKPVDPKWKFTKDKCAELAEWAGIDPAAVTAQSDLIAETLKDRTFEQFKSDHRAARLLCGLKLSDPKMREFRKNNDAFARDRQFHVDARTFESVLKKPFTAPDIVEKKAPIVHEGTLVEAGMKPDADKKIDAVLADWAANDDQAFAVCIVRNGVIVLHKAYGMRDGKPMTVTTKSWMASITKTMSASCMLMLADRKVVDLDQPIWYTQNLNGAKDVTIRHLYTHTSGLAKWPGEWNNDELPDISHRLRNAFPYLKIGAEWAYGGQGYVLGGKLIEDYTGEAMPYFYLKHLLEPLGMANTDVVGTHADAQSVPLDIAKFGQMLLNKGSYGNKRFFRASTFENEMLPRKLTELIGPDATKTFGFGLDGTPEKFGHGAASAATFNIDSKEKMVVVMTRNKMGKNQDKYNGKFWEAIKAGMVNK